MEARAFDHVRIRLIDPELLTVNDSISRADQPSALDVGHQFIRLTSALITGEGGVDPDLVVSLTVHAVAGAERGGLTLLRDRRAPVSVAGTDAVVRDLDRMQQALGQGPYFEPATVDGVVLATDLMHDERWPAFGERSARELGVRSLLCLRLTLGGSDRAALVLYAGRPGAFDDAAVTSASVFAPFAALAAEARLRVNDVDNLRAALATARQIGTAVGIVMARRRVSNDEAFSLLRKTSMDLNRKVNDIAAEVELIGDLPVPERSREGTRAPARRDL